MGLTVRKGDEGYERLLSFYKGVGMAGQFHDGAVWWVGVRDNDGFVFCEVGRTSAFDRHYGATSIGSVKTAEQPEEEKSTKRKRRK